MIRIKTDAYKDKIIKCDECKTKDIHKNVNGYFHCQNCNNVDICENCARKTLVVSFTYISYKNIK